MWFPKTKKNGLTEGFKYLVLACAINVDIFMMLRRIGQGPYSSIGTSTSRFLYERTLFGQCHHSSSETIASLNFVDC